MRIYWINELKKGSLGMMARPKGNDWLEDEILKLKLYDVSMVISLLESSESRELEIQDEEKLCTKHKIEFINFPIKDRNVPKDIKSFLNLISRINENLNNGKKIVVHCRMGIGRTSIVAAAILVKNGMSSETVFDFLTTVRTLSVPDTEDQIKWIQKIEKVLQ